MMQLLERLVAKLTVIKTFVVKIKKTRFLDGKTGLIFPAILFNNRLKLD